MRRRCIYRHFPCDQDQKILATTHLGAVGAVRIHVSLSFTALPIVSETGRLSACCHACSRTQNGLSLVSSQCTSGCKQSWCRWEVMYCIKYKYLFSIRVSMIERPLTDKGGKPLLHIRSAYTHRSTFTRPSS